ncbi:glycosyltransferase family 2 protein [Candidatus Woesearchaeota archaeon]|nr:glycosyltransferase family 2 protein [Candidatus Woesearchaeota archaeon]
MPMNVVVTTLLWAAYFVSLFFAVFWLTVFMTEETKKPMRKKHSFPPVTVGIPAYNEEEGIAATLASVIQLDYPREKLQIIVVDDGSKDQTPVIVRKLIKQHPETNIQLIIQNNGGKGSALNTALTSATGEFFVVLDADSMVDADALHWLLPPFEEDPKLAVTLPCLKIAETKNMLQKMQRYEYIINMFYKELMGRLDCIRVAPGPFSVYRASLLREVGCFDANRNLTEDLEIALRLQKHNYRIRQVMETEVRTNPPNNVRDLYLQRRRWYMGSVINTLKYFRTLVNPKYGDFGLMEVPLSLLSGAMIIFIVTTMVYYAIKPVIETINLLSLVHFDVLSFFRDFHLSFSFLDIKFSLLFIGIIMFSTSMYVLKKSHVNTKERVLRFGAIPLFFYVTMYFFFLGIVWIGVSLNLVVKPQQRVW